MSNHQIIKKTEQFVKDTLSADSTGHDFYHVDRVRKVAQVIAKSEGGVDLFLIELGALLHDIADWKFHDGDEEVGPKKAEEWLVSLEVEKQTIEAVKAIIKEISFKGAGVETPMSTKEGKIVQDADRLDALGAIGIARAFAYGGNKDRPIYDPDIKSKSHGSFDEYKSAKGATINHFYEKLLLLKDRMNTEKGRELAQARHSYMEEFLKRFYNEWSAELTYTPLSGVGRK